MRDADRHTGLWETRPSNVHWPTWSVDPDEGVVQGPLDLGFFDGDGLDLLLDDGQLALLSVRGELRRCFLAGCHTLPVTGSNDSLPPNGLLYFLHLDRTIGIPWKQFLPIRRAEGHAPGPRLARGVFEVAITEPSVFYNAFLCERDGAGEAICRDTLTHLLPTFLAIHLTRTEAVVSDDGAGDDLAQRASQLPSDCLDEDLRPYGIRCVSWTVDSVIESHEPTPA